MTSLLFLKNKLQALVLIFACLVLIATLFPGRVHASTDNWQKAGSIFPDNSEDFASERFRESLRNLRSTGANEVSLMVTYYQTNFYTTDIQSGRGTPSDASLISAIDYAHSLGMKVMLKFHIESLAGGWRAGINPSDRITWFRNYGNMLNKYGVIAQQKGVKSMCMGAEIFRMTMPNYNSTNTANWNQMIQNLRAVYLGELTYSAQRDTELLTLQFWDKLDYIGISGYYVLTNKQDPTVADLVNGWRNFDQNEIQPLSLQYNKKVVFTEIGYRSVRGTQFHPSDWSSQNSYDESIQEKLYEAFFTYWNDKVHMNGVHWWNWEANPSGGAFQNTYYTPQNKAAQNVMTKWFKGSVFQTRSTSSAISSTPSINQTSQITTNITVADNRPNTIVDIEIYNSQNIKVFQKYYEGQNLSAGSSYTYSMPWSSGTSGIYTIKVGLFTEYWSSNFYWNSNSGFITVKEAGVTPTPTPSPTQIITPTPTVTMTPTPIITPSPTSTPTPTPITKNIVLSPLADAFVDSAFPTTNYGKSTRLSVDGVPTQLLTYIKFDLQSLGGKNISKAALRLKTRSTSDGGAGSIDTQYIRTAASSSWTETGINFGNRPLLSSEVVGTITNAKHASWIEVPFKDVVNINKGNIFSFGIDGSGEDGLHIDSREAAIGKPELVIEYTE